MRQVTRIGKKRAKRFFSICLVYTTAYIFLPAITSAQSTTGDYKNQLMFSPLRAIDFVNPGFELMYHRQVSPRFSTAFSGAYMVRVFSNNAHSYNGYRISLAPRYLLQRQRQSTKYVGPEFVYYNTHFPSEIASYNDSITGFQSDTFSISKKMIGVNLMYGKQFYFNRFVVDLAFGLGIKYRDVRHFDRRPMPPLLLKDPNILIESRSERKNWTMNVPMNFRIGYRF